MGDGSGVFKPRPRGGSGAIGVAAVGVRGGTSRIAWVRATATGWGSAFRQAKKSPNEGAFSDVVVIFHREGARRSAVNGSATSLFADLDRDNPQFGFPIVGEVNGCHGGQKDDG